MGDCLHVLVLTDQPDPGMNTVALTRDRRARGGRGAAEEKDTSVMSDNVSSVCGPCREKNLSQLSMPFLPARSPKPRASQQPDCFKKMSF